MKNNISLNYLKFFLILIAINIFIPPLVPPLAEFITLVSAPLWVLGVLLNILYIVTAAKKHKIHKGDYQYFTVSLIISVAIILLLIY